MGSDKLVRALNREDPFRPRWRDVNERAGVEQLRIYRALASQVVDYLLDELNLVGVRPPPLDQRDWGIRQHR